MMTNKWHWFVYILELNNGLYYTGLTWDLPSRFEQHLSGLGGKFTGKYGVRKLIYFEEHEDFELARKREIQIKDFSRKKKKELIDSFKGKFSLTLEQ